MRQSAAAGLGEIGDERVISQLERAAESDSSADVRASAIQSIERIRAQKKAPANKPDK